MPGANSSIAPEPRRILVRGVNWLGDAVMTTSALQRLRERFPTAWIALLAPEKLADLWRHHPSIDKIIPFQPGSSPWQIARILKSTAAEAGASKPEETSGRAPAFDLALILPNSPRSALESWLARIPNRVGYAQSWRNWFLTQKISRRPGHVELRKLTDAQVQKLVQKTTAVSHPLAPVRPDSHQIFEYLHLAAALGADPEPIAPKLDVAPEELEAAVHDLAQIAGNPKSTVREPMVWLGLNPSAAYGMAKRWPVENFAAVARAVSRQLPKANWLIFGTNADLALCSQIAESVGGKAFNLAGKTSLRELMAKLKLCRVLLTNDSGPMHVAAALGTPVVVPFGSTSPGLTGPGLPGDPRHKLLQAVVPCAPCFRRTCPIDLRCLTGITVERVTNAVIEAVEAEMRA